MKNDKVKIIGICGQKGNGKSELYKAITTHLKSDKVVIINLPFAKRLKEVLAKFVSTMLEVDQEVADRYFYDPRFKETPISLFNASSRTLMQRFGTDFVRGINPNFWVDDVRNIITKNMHRLNYTEDKTIVYVVDDCRFFDELEMLRSLQADIIYISKEKHSKLYYWWIVLLNKIKGVHQSEMPLNIYKKDSELEYVNNGTLEDMRKWVIENINL